MQVAADVPLEWHMVALIRFQVTAQGGRDRISMTVDGKLALT